MKYKRFLPFIAISIVIATNLFFGLPRLVKYSAVDEHLWTYDRTPAYWEAVAAHSWKNTDINDKPGITVALVSGMGLLSGASPGDYDKMRAGEQIKTPAQVSEMKKINFDFRLPVYLFTLLLAPIFYFFLKNLLGVPAAVFSIILIYLSPVLLGMSLFVNPDSILWLFIPLSILSFLLFQKDLEQKYAVLSGVFLGLALLTKYVASILYPFFLLLIPVQYFLLEKKPESQRWFRQNLLGYGLSLLVSTAVVIILYPAVWTDSKYLLSTTFLNDPFQKFFPVWLATTLLLFGDTFLLKNKVTLFILQTLARYKRIIIRLILVLFLGTAAFIFLNTYSGMPLYDFQAVVTLAKFKETTNFFAKIFTDGILSGAYLLAFTLTPITLLFFLYTFLTGLSPKNILKENSLAAFYLLLFILAYYVSFAAENVHPIVRYQISIYPIAAIIAAIGLSRLIETERLERYLTVLNISIFLVILSAATLFFSRPFYFAYASSLLPQKYVLNLNDMGDGSFEAAEFLNKLPHAQELYVWTDKVAVCEYFVGHCDTSLQKGNTSQKHFDYYVVSSAREARTLYIMDEKRYLKGPSYDKIRNAYISDEPSDFKLIIGNRPGNFVKVVKNKD